MHPTVLLILSVLSERGATLFQDGAALIIDYWPGSLPSALDRAIDLHETELRTYATPVDPWADAADENAPTEACDICGGLTFFRAGDGGLGGVLKPTVLPWVCETCHPEAALDSYRRAWQASEQREVQMTDVRGRRYPRTVRPWERKAG